MSAGLFQRWKAFLFKPETPYAMAALRIAFGILTFIYFLGIYNTWFWIGADGAATVSDFDLHGYWISPLYSLMSVLDPTAHLRIAILPFGLIAMVFVAFGFFTRLSTLVSVIAIFSLNSRGIPSLEGSFELMKYIGLALLFSPAGKVMSIDRFLRIKFGKEDGKTAPLCPVLSKRFLQFLFTTVYISTVAWKLTTQSWRDGSAVYYATHMDGFSFLAPLWMFEYRWLTPILTWGSLVVESAMGILIWIKPIRKPLLLIGLLFHLFLAISINVPFFQETLVSFYLLFLEEEDYLRMKVWCLSFVARLGLSRDRSPQVFPPFPSKSEIQILNFRRDQNVVAALLAVLCSLWLFFSLPYFYLRKEFRPNSAGYKPLSLFELTLTWPMFFKLQPWTANLRVVANYADGSTLILDRQHLAQVGLDGRANGLHFYHWSLFRTLGIKNRAMKEAFVRQAGPLFLKLMTRGGERPLSVEFDNWVTHTPEFWKSRPGVASIPGRAILIGRFTDPDHIEVPN